jgi:hypothetical protein
MTSKSVGAVVAGFVGVVVITTAVDAILHAVRVFPPLDQPLDTALSGLALSYRVVIGIAGGWLTARLAPTQPVRHAVVLGVIGTVAGTVGAVATWNLGLGPRWYPIAVAALALPECLVGAWLVSRNASREGGRAVV